MKGERRSEMKIEWWTEAGILLAHAQEEGGD